MGHRPAVVQPILALLALCLLVRSARAADNVPLVISQEAFNGATATSEDGGDREACQVVFRPYSIWQPPLGSNPEAKRLKLPTANPPPEYVGAALTFFVFNRGTQDIAAGWNFTYVNKNFTNITDHWNYVQTSFDSSSKILSGYVNNTSGYELKANGDNNVTIGFSVRADTNNFLPESFFVNDIKCTVNLINNVSGFLPFQDPNSGSIESSEQPLSISNGEFYDVNGQKINLNCANYFGFNNGNVMLDGLWAGGSALTRDFGTVLYRIQLLGINCLRVPFSFQTLFNVAPQSKAGSCNPATDADIRANVIKPGVNVPSSAKLPPQAFKQGNDPSICNQYLPNDSVYHRFLYILQFLARNNFYVLTDDHSEDPTIQTNPTAWPTLWASIVKDIIADEPSKNRVFVDILNEPDHAGFRWENLSPLYLAAMDAIHAVSPTTVMLVEGTGQQGYPGINWGDGFVTDRSLISRYGLSDANVFFSALQSKPYLDLVGISPHVYPPSVTYATQGYNANNGLYDRLWTSFGYLRTIGYAKHIFPILIGEMGSKFATDADKQSMADQVKWLTAQPNTGTKHEPIQNVAYWSWNSNSGDTGGLVDSNVWTDVQWTKIQWMIDAMGLQPWYLVASNSVPANTVSPPPPASPPPPPYKASPPPPPVKSPPPPPPVKSPPPAKSPPPSPPPTKSPPPPPPQKSQPPPVVGSKPALSASSCSATIGLENGWSDTSGYYNSVNIYLQNMGSTAVNTPFTVTAAQSNYVSLQQAWNWDASFSGTTVSGTVNAGSWQNLQPSGGSTASFGFVVKSKTNSFKPTSITLNGAACTVA